MIGESYLPKEKGAVKEIKNIDKIEKEDNNKTTINNVLKYL